MLERRIGEHPERSSGERKLEGVALEDGHTVRLGEALRQSLGEHWIDLDGEDARSAVRERGGEAAGPGTELDDVIRRRDAGVGREASGERCAFEEVLSEIPTVRPPGS